MMDGLKLYGRVKWIKIWNPDGSLARHIPGGPNQIVVDGFHLAAGLIAGEALTPISHMAAGDGQAQPNENQADLQGTELARTTVTTSRVDNEITYTANFSSIGSNIDVTEFGLFNDGVAGDMFCRFVVEEFTLFSGQSMDIAWEIRVGK